MNKEQLFEKRMIELSKNAYYRGILTFSDFLDLNELHMLHGLPLHQYGVKVETYGGHALAERQMAAFIPDAFFFQPDYPLSCICLKPSAAKFAETLTHRDYLGAILNLGIERSKIGDILVEDKKAYVFCHETLAPFLLEELHLHTDGSGRTYQDPSQKKSDLLFRFPLPLYLHPQNVPVFLRVYQNCPQH